MLSTPLSPEMQNLISRRPEVETIERWGFVRSVIRQAKERAGLKINAGFFMILTEAIRPAVLAAYNIVATDKAQAQQLAQQTRPRRSTSTALAESLLGSAGTKGRAQRNGIGNSQAADDGVVTVAKRFLLREGGPYLHRSFEELFGRDKDAQDRADAASADDNGVPILLAAPYPAMLHAYVYGLGLLKDWSATVAFAKWLGTHRKAIDEAAEMPSNGLAMRRKTVIALRVFLERTWLAVGKPEGSNQKESAIDSECNEKGVVHRQEEDLAAPQAVIEEIRNIVESLDDWGGWPTDDEIYEYCFGPAAGNFPPE